VIVGYTIVAFRLWVAIMNSIIAVATGLVLLGFAGWRGTAGLADGCITWVFSAAIKLFFLDLLLYVSEATLPLVQGELDLVLSTQSLLAFTAALSWPGSSRGSPSTSRAWPAASSVATSTLALPAPSAGRP
jgi:type IV secretory pathway TrbL component